MNYFIYGEITGETAQDFVQNFKTLKEKELLIIHLNSAGGEIFSALSIYNLIKNRAGVEIRIEGLAASAATLICCGAKVAACKNSLVMLHLPLVGLGDYYNEKELAKLQQSLAALKASLIETYSGKLKMDTAEIEQLLMAEEWKNAEEAQKLGLVDEIEDIEVEMKLSADKKILFVNSISVTNFKNLTEVIKLEENKNEDSKAIMGKYKNAILTAERARVSALMAMKTDSPAVNSIINKAIENGDEVEKIKPYINAITETQIDAPKIKNLDELYKMITDNMQSGAANVTASSPPPDEKEKNAAYVDDVAKYANEILKGAC